MDRGQRSQRRFQAGRLLKPTSERERLQRSAGPAAAEPERRSPIPEPAPDAPLPVPHPPRQAILAGKTLIQLSGVLQEHRIGQLRSRRYLLALQDEVGYAGPALKVAGRKRHLLADTLGLLLLFFVGSLLEILLLTK